jgi:translation initiation factor IF-2
MAAEMVDKHKEVPPGKRPKIEIVLKCDSAGSLEAVTAAIANISLPGADISIIRSGIGAVGRSDVLLAETCSRLVVGFQVDASAGLERPLREHGVEVRLYDVIYRLIEDIGAIAESLVPSVEQEQTIGAGKVIALFKSSRKGIIIGCEVLDGFLALGQHFRVISAMGPVYSGIIESLHIREEAVQKAVRGQQVGIKIRDFDKARIGDLVESYRPLPQGKARAWQPSGKIIRK